MDDDEGDNNAESETHTVPDDVVLSIVELHQVVWIHKLEEGSKRVQGQRLKVPGLVLPIMVHRSSNQSNGRNEEENYHQEQGPVDILHQLKQNGEPFTELAQNQVIPQRVEVLFFRNLLLAAVAETVAIHVVGVSALRGIVSQICLAVLLGDVPVWRYLIEHLLHFILKLICLIRFRRWHQGAFPLGIGSLSDKFSCIALAALFQSELILRNPYRLRSIARNLWIQYLQLAFIRKRSYSLVVFINFHLKTLIIFIWLALMKF